MRARMPLLPLMLISLYGHWTEEQRNTFPLCSRDEALARLSQETGKNYGYKVWQWSLYYVFKGDLDGIYHSVSVIWGHLTGSNLRWLQRMKEILDDGGRV